MATVEHVLDIEVVVRALDPGARILTATQLKGGVSAEVHAVLLRSSDGREDAVVLRHHRVVEGKSDRHERAAREHALLGVLHARGLPVPRSRLFFPPVTLVLDRMNGTTMLPPNPAEQLGATLANIHAVTAADGLPELPLLLDPVPALREWTPELFANRAIEAGSLAYAGTPRLLHGDYWPGNVLWEGDRLAAVIDWEDAALGDPLSDVACARVELCCAAGEATAAPFTEAYQSHANAALDRLPWWDLYVATAALKYMDGWGLAPEVAAARRSTTEAFRSRALCSLGIV